MNGLFWWDFLARVPVDPVHFALGYYARYPAINPIAYPPVFYLLEGVCYHIFGISPFVAKGLVVAFALFGCLYLMAWLRRWVSPLAGWAAILFLLQPAIMVWANAVMLNVPCTALGIAALYHWRRGLDDPGSRQIYWSAACALLAVFTYMPAIIVGLVMLGWAVTEKKCLALGTRLWVVVGTALTLLLPWMLLTSKWNKGYRQVALFQGPYPYWRIGSWIYYPKQIPVMMTMPVIGLALIGLLLSVRMKNWRKEIRFALIWLVGCYLWFSVFSVKEPRYVLLLVPPVIILCTVGVVEIAETLQWLSLNKSPQLIVAGLLLLLFMHLREVSLVFVPRVSGFEQVVPYLRQIDPNSWVFYDGHYNELFTYFYRIQDPHFTGGVVRADKLLYSGKISVKFGLAEYVSSPQEVLDLLKHRSGSKYLVAERQMTDVVRPELYLREALSGSDFRLVRSFHVETPRVSDLDVYEYTGDLSVPQEHELRFLNVGQDATFRVKPIPSE